MATVEHLLKALGKGVICLSEPREGRVYVTIEPTALRAAAGEMLKHEARFMLLTATDEGLDVELLYHFDVKDGVIALRVKVAKEVNEVDSIVDLAPAAEWAEKEAAELFGVSFRAHPKPAHLLLPDEWPAGEYPLGRPFKGQIPEQLCPVAESLISLGVTAPISPPIKRRRKEASLPEQPPASYSSEPHLRELHELIKQTGLDEKAGYDWRKKKLRGGP